MIKNIEDNRKMSKKVKVLIVLSFIFLALAVTAFIYDALLISALKDVQKDTENGLGAAVAATTLVIIFVIFSAVFALINAVNIIISAILIKLTAKGWRVYYIVITSLSALLTSAIFILYGIIQQ